MCIRDSNENVQGVSFAQVVQNDMKFKGLTSEAGMLPRVTEKLRASNTLESWDEWREHWRASLELLAAEIREGLATITPAKKACAFCELKPLCRYRADDSDSSEGGVS